MNGSRDQDLTAVESGDSRSVAFELNDYRPDGGGSSEAENPQLGRAIAEGRTDLGSALAHLYRGEMDRVTTWRQRLDRTTYWAVTLMAAILTWAFSSRNNPHYILLVGMAVVGVFLWIEARRYRAYDVWRTRARALQENLFATILDPSRGSTARTGASG